MKKKLFLLTLGTMLLFAPAACAGGGGRAAAPSGEITIVMKELNPNKYAYEPNTIRVKAGQEVRITLVNEGEKDHEFMVGRDVMIMNGNPSGFKEDFFEGIEVRAERNGQPVELAELSGEEGAHEHEAEEMGHHGFMALLYEGDEPVTLIFTVPEDKVGEWEIGCFQDDGDHWEKGMKGKLIVEK